MLTIDVEDIRNGDYSPAYGTVVYVKHEAETVHLEFKNGEKISQPFGAEMEIQQGGR